MRFVQKDRPIVGRFRFTMAGVTQLDPRILAIMAKLNGTPDTAVKEETKKKQKEAPRPPQTMEEFMQMENLVRCWWTSIDPGGRGGGSASECEVQHPNQSFV